MDLEQFDTVSVASKGAVMELLHPDTGVPLKDDDGTTVTITLQGADGEKFRDRQRRTFDDQLQGRRRRKSKSPSPKSAEELESESVELLADLTVEWHGIGLDGASLECSWDNAVAVYQRFPWIREQADAFVVDRGNFLPKP